MVGNAIGSKLVQLGHKTKMGSRTQSNEKAIQWAKANGPKASYGTFSEAAEFAEIIFNCTAGAASLEALKLADARNLKDKVLIDISTHWISPKACHLR